MSLQVRISEDVKEAMRARQDLRRDTLRMVLAALKNRRIELGHDLEEADEIAVLTSSVKSRVDSAQQYEKAGRQELADKERAEIEVIQTYLPRQLGEEETAALVQSKIDELGVTSGKDLGRVMKAVMADHKGRVDGALVRNIAGRMLA